jgi:hypothetical protein
MDWEGDERRGIPIHILNHIDDRLSEHADRVELKLNEIARISLERHDQLVALMGVQVQKQQRIEDAFLRNEHGEPDIAGHFYDHDHRRRFGEWWEKKKDGALTKVFDAGVLAFCLWLFYTIWEAFLRGPRQ